MELGRRKSVLGSINGVMQQILVDTSNDVNLIIDSKKKTFILLVVRKGHCYVNFFKQPVIMESQSSPSKMRRLKLVTFFISIN